MPTLGQELSRLRALKGWTLREVEERTKNKVSNSYLYQLEKDNVKGPSPNILYELSVVYRASYPDLMKLAGFIVPSSAGAAPASVAFNALDLTEEEKAEVMDFIEFKRRKKKANQQ
jgi:transcriptional regulator with XRE-family HTH domain